MKINWRRGKSHTAPSTLVEGWDKAHNKSMGTWEEISEGNSVVAHFASFRISLTSHAI